MTTELFMIIMWKWNINSNLFNSIPRHYSSAPEWTEDYTGYSAKYNVIKCNIIAKHWKDKLHWSHLIPINRPSMSRRSLWFRCVSPNCLQLQPPCFWSNLQAHFRVRHFHFCFAIIKHSAAKSERNCRYINTQGVIDTHYLLRNNAGHVASFWLICFWIAVNSWAPLKKASLLIVSLMLSKALIIILLAVHAGPICISWQAFDWHRSGRVNDGDIAEFCFYEK